MCKSMEEMRNELKSTIVAMIWNTKFWQIVNYWSIDKV